MIILELSYEKLTLLSKDYIDMTDRDILNLLNNQKNNLLSSEEERKLRKLFELCKKHKGKDFIIRSKRINVGFEYISLYIDPVPLDVFNILSSPEIWLDDSVIDNIFYLFNFRQYLLKCRYNSNKIIYILCKLHYCQPIQISRSQFKICYEH